jgi:hypothetical protein
MSSPNPCLLGDQIACQPLKLPRTGQSSSEARLIAMCKRTIDLVDDVD